MRAILINPWEQEIKEVDTNGSIQEIYKLIDCEGIDAVYLTKDGEVMYVDGEGLFRDPQRFFMLVGKDHPLAGRGLIFGTNEEGDSVDTKLSVSFMKAAVSWCRPDMRFAGMTTEEKKTTHPLFGPEPVQHIISTPHFMYGAKKE